MKDLAGTLLTNRENFSSTEVSCEKEGKGRTDHGEGLPVLGREDETHALSVDRVVYMRVEERIHCRR